MAKKASSPENPEKLFALKLKKANVKGRVEELVVKNGQCGDQSILMFIFRSCFANFYLAKTLADWCVPICS